jgi:CBS domain-containing protein
MMNRKLADIVKGQKLVALAERETVQEACRYMWECRTGSVLVLDDQQRLTGILPAAMQCARLPKARALR